MQQALASLRKVDHSVSGSLTRRLGLPLSVQAALALPLPVQRAALHLGYDAARVERECSSWVPVGRALGSRLARTRGRSGLPGNGAASGSHELGRARCAEKAIVSGRARSECVPGAFASSHRGQAMGVLVRIASALSCSCIRLVRVSVAARGT